MGLVTGLVCALAVTIALGFSTGADLGLAGSGFASVAMILVFGAGSGFSGFTSGAACLTSLLGVSAGTGSGFASTTSLLAIRAGSGSGFSSDGASTFGSTAMTGLVSGPGGTCTGGGVSSDGLATCDGSGCGAGFASAGGVSTLRAAAAVLSGSLGVSVPAPSTFAGGAAVAG